MPIYFLLIQMMRVGTVDNESWGVVGVGGEVECSPCSFYQREKSSDSNAIEADR